MQSIWTALPRAATRSTATTGTCRRCLHLTLSQRSTAHIAQKPSTAPTLTKRCLHSSVRALAAPKSKDRGPASKEDTQTDFGAMNVLNNTPVPTTAIDACMDDGFALNSGLKITGAGVLLIGGEAFKWRPWMRSGSATPASTPHKNSSIPSGGKICNSKAQLEPDELAWGVLDLVWPKPDLLILGTGASIVPPSPETRRRIAALGIRVEVQDTRNAAAQFNLLATERGLQQVAAALVPIGWRE
jgi:NADH dehydrogenase [ubiquinone] 1 alpha subcomplex assembly factor 3